MEVMIAALILTLSVVATMSIVGTARSNILREERRWTREHLTTNAAEFFLLAGPEGQLVDGLIPSDYSATCELYNVDEGLPEDALESINQWRLGEFHIQLFDKQGDLVEEQRVRKIVKEDDLGYTEMGAGSRN